MRYAHISRNSAEEILSNFVLMEIIRIQTTQEGTRFTLNTEFDQNELDKFK